MPMPIHVAEVERKTFQAVQRDGLMELAIGLCLVAMSGRLLARFLIFTLAFPFFMPRLLLVALRKRFTYPRVGYVKLIPEEAKEVVPGIFLLLFVLIAIVAIAFLLFGNIGDFGLWEKWSPAIFGTQLAGLFASLGSKSGSGRYWVFAVWSVMSGLVFSIVDFEFRAAGLFLYFLSIGALPTVWGLVMFVRFLREYPIAAGEEIDVNP